MESFAGLLQKLVVLCVSQYFVEVDARFCGVLIRNTNIDTERQENTTTVWKEHQMAVFSISERHLCSWKVLCTGVKSNEGKSIENSTISSQISVVVDLHEESGLITQQIITNSITLP